MPKWYDVETSPPKRSGEYLIHMCCEKCAEKTERETVPLYAPKLDITK